MKPQKGRRTLFHTLNLWLFFNLLLLISSYVRHWPNVGFHMWINESFYFLLFLLCICVALKNAYNRDIFYILGVYLLANALSFILVFMGDQYPLGTNYSVYQWLHYKKLLLTALFLTLLLNIVLKYLDLRLKTINRYLMVGAAVTGIFTLSFYPYWKNPGLIFQLGLSYRADLYSRLLFPHLLGFTAVLIYGIILYIQDRVLGTYINLLMASLALWSVTGIVEVLSEILHFKVHAVTQWVITLNLIFLTIIIMKKLVFINTDYGRFYEDLQHSRICLGDITVQRYHAESNDRLLHILKIYLVQRRIYLLSLVICSLLIMIYFGISKFFAINLLVLIIMLGALFFYTSALYRKRAGKKFTLPINEEG